MSTGYTTEMTAGDVVAAVFKHFDGEAPVRDGVIDLNLIVLEVLVVLQQRGFLDLEVKP